MKNKLHKMMRINLEGKDKQTPVELKPCGCALSADHIEAYQDYLERARKAGYKWAD